jgi:predicted kinase
MDDIERHLPEAPGWSVNWDGIDAAFPWIRKLRGSTQDPRHHAEGDVWTHVAMVCSEMAASTEWRSLDRQERLETFAAALLHDVCKPETRRVEDDGRITNRGHSRMGANEARQILWGMDFPFASRERVCAMIAVHQAPFWLLERPAWEADRILVSTSLSVPNRLLAILASADAKGRVCEDRQRIVDNVELFREAALERGCLDGPFAFANDHSRFQYFLDAERKRPDVALHDTTGAAFEMTLLSGLPATGKSTWTERATRPGGTLEGQPVLSLDGLREEMDVDASDNQGTVVQAGRERAREFLRARRSFVWDGTNLSRQFRAAPLQLAADYGARVRIAYVEAPQAEMRERNRSRAARVPDDVVRRMMNRWEVPTLAECHDLEVAVSPAPSPGHGSRAPGR